MPFRTSPTVKHNLLFSHAQRPLPKPLLTPAATPGQSSDDDAESPPYHSSTPYLSGQINAAQIHLPAVSTFPNDDDSDTDMGDCQPRNSPAPSDSLTASFANVTYGSSQESQHIFSGGRIPTPRWGHFRSIDTSIDMIDAPPSTGNPSATQLEPGYIHRQRRRLPSPISEDESMVFPANAISPSGMTEEIMYRLDMRLDNSCSTEYIQRTASQLAEEPASIQIRGKAKLSMGYRADCEKCRARVPGHYNHVIRT